MIGAVVGAVKSGVARAISRISKNEVEVSRPGENPHLNYSMEDPPLSGTMAIYHEYIMGPVKNLDHITYYLPNIWKWCDDEGDLVRWLALLDLHEMTHWAMEEDTEDEDHGERWDPVLIEQIKYTRGQNLLEDE